MTPEQCSKCEGPLDTTGYPNWCRACRARYKRDYEATKKTMFASHGFRDGVLAMRGYLAERFAQYGSAGSFTGTEIAQTIERCPGPRPNDEA